MEADSGTLSVAQSNRAINRNERDVYAPIPPAVTVSISDLKAYPEARETGPVGAKAKEKTRADISKSTDAESIFILGLERETKQEKLEKCLTALTREMEMKNKREDFVSCLRERR